MRLVNLSNYQQFTAINLLSDPGSLGGPVVIPNLVQIVFNWVLADGKTGHNVMYGRAAGVPSPTPTQAEAIRTAVTTGALWTAVATAMSGNSALSSVSLRSVHTAGNPLVLSTGSASNGTNAGIALPNETAICVTLRTALAGPSNRGRIYIPNFAVDQVLAGNTITAGTVTAVSSWVNSFTSVFAGQGYTWVIGQPARAAYTGSTGTAHPARAAGSVAVTSATVRNNTWDSQRRRGLK